MFIKTKVKRLNTLHSLALIPSKTFKDWNDLTVTQLRLSSPSFKQRLSERFTPLFLAFLTRLLLTSIGTPSLILIGECHANQSFY